MYKCHNDHTITDQHTTMTQDKLNYCLPMKEQSWTKTFLLFKT